MVVGGGGGAAHQGAAGVPGDDDDEAGSSGQGRRIDPARLHNENRKLQRLLAKQQDEMKELREQVQGFSKHGKTVESLRSIFMGEGQSPRQDKEGDEVDPSLTLHQRALEQHNRLLETDPDSQGIPFTLDLSRASEEAYKLAKEQAGVIKKLQERLDLYEKPAYTAHQQMAMNLEGILRDRLEELFGDVDSADQNYPDFERIATERLRALSADPARKNQWRKFLTSKELQQRFIDDIVQSKLPRAYLQKLGAKGLSGEGDYTPEQAHQDMQTAMKMKAGPARAALMKKARQRLLPETLGLDLQALRR